MIQPSSGIIHHEMPQLSPIGTLWGFQYWANLPTSIKMMSPRYRDLPAPTIPGVSLASGSRVKVVSGIIGGVRGQVQDIVIGPELQDISIPARSVFEHTIKSGHTVVAYVVTDSGFFDERRDSFSFDYAGSDCGRTCAMGPETTVLYDELIRVTEGVLARTETPPFSSTWRRKLFRPIQNKSLTIYPDHLLNDEIEVGNTQGATIKHKALPINFPNKITMPDIDRPGPGEVCRTRRYFQILVFMTLLQVLENGDNLLRANLATREYASCCPAAALLERRLPGRGRS